MKSALLVLSSGIGNVVRWTPAITILNQLGYLCDVWLLDPDYPAVAALLAPSPLIRRTIVNGQAPEDQYDVALVSHWAKVQDSDLNAVAVLRYPHKDWIRDGDNVAVAWTAIMLGYTPPLPPPFVVKLEREFNLPSGTVAFHAGRKKGWAQKEWAGWEELFAYFENVVIVGAGYDGRASDFGYPYSVFGDFVGRLSLPDTAALISQCAALISTDTGLSHVAAALGIPVFPIYGITRPAREAMPLPNVHPIELRSQCHEGCASIRYNARNCPGNLACLRNLTADNVARLVKTVLAVSALSSAVR